MFFQSRPCLSVTTHCCVITQSVGPSWVASPGSPPARMFSVTSTVLVSSAAPPPSARPAPRLCPGSWTLCGRSFRPLRSTKPWCWQACDRIWFWTSAPALWPSGAIRSSILLFLRCGASSSMLLCQSCLLLKCFQVHQERLYQEYSLSRADSQLKQMEKVLTQQNQSRELELTAMKGEITSLKKVNGNSSFS